MPVTWTTFTEAPAATGASAVSDPGAAPPGGGPGRERSARADAPLAHAVIRPHRSLSRAGFQLFLLIVWCFLMVPLVPLLGTVALWVMLPFMLGALGLVWLSIERNYRDGALREELFLWPDRILVVRHDPGAPPRSWEANPYWVRVTLHPGDRPVEDYLTLKGAGREIELGVFLSPEERRQLKADLEAALARARAAPPPAA